MKATIAAVTLALAGIGWSGNAMFKGYLSLVTPAIALSADVVQGTALSETWSPFDGLRMAGAID